MSATLIDARRPRARGARTAAALWNLCAGAIRKRQLLSEPRLSTGSTAEGSVRCGLCRASLGLALLIGTSAATGAAERDLEVAITPLPADVEVLGGVFTIERQTPLLVQGGAPAEAVARYFGELLARVHGWQPQIVPATDAKRVIQFTLAAGSRHPPEGYRLDVSSRAIMLEAADQRGLFYGAVSLVQLSSSTQGEEVRVPALRIVDVPRLRWRGLLLDSAQRYQPVEYIKHFIDAMALHKLNVLHWRFADDQAWRLEISKYPKLTAASTGVYTQREVRDVLQYAAARHVSVVPGFEMPGQAGAAVAAYPQLAAAPAANAAAPAFFNVDEATFTFLDEVFAEVAALFPAEYIHIGASDADKSQWAAAARVQARMRELGLANEHRLQRYFVDRVGTLLARRGRRLAGWDGALSGAPAGSLVTTAKSLDGALTAAGAGYDVVVSSATLDLDHRQTLAEEEPLARDGLISLADVYKFDPAPTALSTQDRSRLIGVQANVWTMTMASEADVERMTFPRAAALAEIAWSPPARLSWPDFQRRLVPLMAQYARLGIRHSDAAFRVLAIQRGVTRGRVAVELAKQVPLGEIRYTTNGTEPSVKSPAYVNLLELPLPTTLKAAAFYNGEQLARTITVTLDASTAGQ